MTNRQKLLEPYAKENAEALIRLQKLGLPWDTKYEEGPIFVKIKYHYQHEIVTVIDIWYDFEKPGAFERATKDSVHKMINEINKKMEELLKL